jgi:large subunit ribosomal protein L24e
MVVKTTACYFTEERIYPGHGIFYIKQNGKKLEFINRKSRNLYLGGRKPLNLRWTKAWRRAHKKESILRQVKKEKRKHLKAERGIEGLSLQDLLRKKNETEESRKAAREKPAVVGGGGAVDDKKLSLRQRLKALKQKQSKQQTTEKGGATGKGAKTGKEKQVSNEQSKSGGKATNVAAGQKKPATTGGGAKQQKQKQGGKGKNQGGGK